MNKHLKTVIIALNFVGFFSLKPNQGINNQVSLGTFNSSEKESLVLSHEKIRKMLLKNNCNPVINQLLNQKTQEISEIFKPTITALNKAKINPVWLVNSSCDCFVSEEVELSLVKLFSDYAPYLQELYSYLGNVFLKGLIKQILFNIEEVILSNSVLDKNSLPKKFIQHLQNERKKHNREKELVTLDWKAADDWIAVNLTTNAAKLQFAAGLIVLVTDGGNFERSEAQPAKLDVSNADVSSEEKEPEFVETQITEKPLVLDPLDEDENNTSYSLTEI